MPRTLLIMRHAKSSWSGHGLIDHDRKLAKRGKRDARRMGEELRDRDLLPDIILSSTARRARSTVRRMVKASGYSGRVVDDPALYFGDLADHLRTLSALPDEMQSAMLVGHNPLLEELLHHLAGRRIRLPTTALACLDLPIDTWRGLTGNTRGTLRLFLWAKELQPA